MYLKLMSYYLEQQRWHHLSAEKMRQQQVQKFRQLFEYARTRSSFYQKIYQEAGIEKLEIRTFEDIQKVPVVDKAMMRRYSLQEIVTSPITPELVEITTSGSTGEPFVVYQTKLEQYTSHLRVFGLLMELGYRPWHRILMLTRLEPDVVLPVERDLSLLTKLRQIFKLFRREIISIYTPSKKIVEWTRRYPDARIFWSTPGIMTILCTYLEEQALQLSFDLVILTSETLQPEQRERFSRCMGGARVVSHYGLMECPTIGFDSGRDERKEIFGNACLMEVLNIEERGGVLQGEPVLTNLVNRTMPFIRYNTHDSAVVLNDPLFPCKIIGPISGRLDDVLQLPNGKQFAHHHAYALFTDFTECLQYKFLQDDRGNIILRLRTQAGVDLAEVRHKALIRWQQRYADVPLQIEFVATMPIDPKSGKFKNIERHPPAVESK